MKDIIDEERKKGRKEKLQYTLSKKNHKGSTGQAHGWTLPYGISLT